LKDIKKIIGILVVSYLLFAGIVAWLVWDSLKQNGFTGSELYTRFGIIIGIFIVLSAMEFWLKYKVGMAKTLLIRGLAVGIGVGIISYVMGYTITNSAMWGMVFGIIYYFWDRSKMIRLQNMQK
jgi:hypothetical protein